MYKGWWEIVLDLRPLENRYFCEAFGFLVCQLALLFWQTRSELKGRFVVFPFRVGTPLTVPF